MEAKLPNKILISGGWGYGNIGDDAILAATVKVVKKKYPKSEIIVMTYDIEETRRVTNLLDIKFIPSIHRYITEFFSGIVYKSPNEDAFLKVSSGKVKRITTKINNKVIRTVIGPILKKSSYHNYLKVLSDLSQIPCYNDFKSADLFIQAGGGYFNDGWVDSLYGRVLELLVAKQVQTKSLVLGQSIGPFNDVTIREIAVLGLKSASLVSIRDKESYKELASYGVETVLIPDTALSQTDYNFESDSAITFVAGGAGLKEDAIRVISSSLEKVSLELKCRIKVLVSRTWTSDIDSAYQIFKILNSSGLDVSIIIPDTLSQLQRHLGESKVIVSQNLHGLILGWRSGVPGVSLNTERKFVAFMEQSGQKSRLLSKQDLSEEKLTKLIHEAWGCDDVNNLRLKLSEEINLNIDDIFEKVGMLN